MQNEEAVPILSPLHPPHPFIPFKVSTAAGLLFIPLLALLTWKLLQSRPVPDDLRAELAGLWAWLPFLLAKSVHVGGFTLLAFLSQLALTARFRALAAALLVLHGAATELAQTRVPNRTGTATDVAIDASGVALGVVAARRLARRGLGERHA